jgi:hypothetical protein
MRKFRFYVDCPTDTCTSFTLREVHHADTDEERETLFCAGFYDSRVLPTELREAAVGMLRALFKEEYVLEDGFPEIPADAVLEWRLSRKSLGEWWVMVGAQSEIYAGTAFFADKRADFDDALREAVATLCRIVEIERQGVTADFDTAYAELQLRGHAILRPVDPTQLN